MRCRRLMRNCALAMLPLVLGNIMSAQTPDADLRQEITALRQGQEAMQKDLADVKALLEKLTAPQRPAGPVVRDVEFDIGDNPVLGDAAAKLILVEFADYECPFCGRHVRETFPQIKERYIDAGVLRYAAVDMPLPMHPNAAKAAEASHCAGEQGRFWEIHELMMAKQDALANPSSYAAALNLDRSKFERCLEEGKYAAAVDADVALAQTLGVDGVPGFVLARVEAADAGGRPLKVRGVAAVQGALPFAAFRREIDAALAAQ